MKIKNNKVEIEKDFEEELKNDLMEEGLTEDEAERAIEELKVDHY